jgi:hypothetical protein
MFSSFGGGHLMPFTRFGDSYSFRLSSGILLGAWEGRLLSGALTKVPVCYSLVGRSSRGGDLNDYQLVGWLVGEVADYILLYFDCGASCCLAQWNERYVEQRRGRAAV